MKKGDKLIILEIMLGVLSAVIGGAELIVSSKAEKYHDECFKKELEQEYGLTPIQKED